MSVLAHEPLHGMSLRPQETAISLGWTALRRQRRLVLAFAIGFPIGFYLFLLALMSLRFGNLPNYVTPYDWIGNVSRIVASTGSVADMFRIARDEWLLEIGFMNYDYGLGVSEWSLLIIPHALIYMMFVGALVGLNFALIADQPILSWQAAARCGLLTSFGALCASLMGITLFWVVCHSSPTWVVSLAILGAEISTSLALEPIGPVISGFGVAMLLLSAWLIVRDGRSSAARISGGEAAAC